MKRRQRISGRSRIGFTLVELLLVIGIIGLLVGLTLPAIQMVRESARRTACQNNLRQLVLATLGHESAHGYLVGPLFRGLPTEPNNRGNAGLFVQLLPYLEHQNLYGQFDSSSPTVSLPNQIPIQHCPEFLRCPTSMPSRLTGLAAQFSGPAIDDLQSETCDYIGNGGWFSPDVFRDNPESMRGAISTQVSHIRPALRLAGIADGTSHTFLYWENCMSRLKRFPMGELVDVDSNVPGQIFFSLGADSFVVNTVASVKSYFYTWCGNRTGAVWVFDTNGTVGNPFTQSQFSRAINVVNEAGQPFSFHPGGGNFVLADGSVHFLAETTDSKVIAGAATINDGRSPF